MKKIGHILKEKFNVDSSAISEAIWEANKRVGYFFVEREKAPRLTLEQMADALKIYHTSCGNKCNVIPLHPDRSILSTAALLYDHNWKQWEVLPININSNRKTVTVASIDPEPSSLSNIWDILNKKLWNWDSLNVDIVVAPQAAIRRLLIILENKGKREDYSSCFNRIS